MKACPSLSWMDGEVTSTPLGRLVLSVAHKTRPLVAPLCISSSSQAAHPGNSCVAMLLRSNTFAAARSICLFFLVCTLAAFGLQKDAFAQQVTDTSVETLPDCPLIEVRFKAADRPPLVGEKIAQNAKYGLLVLNADGELIAIPPAPPATDGEPSIHAIESIAELSGVLSPTPAKELAKKMLVLMPKGSKSIVTEHFVVCYDTTDIYARWNANLYERMFKGMIRFWKEKGIDLHPPRFPMVALIFSNQRDYVQYSKRDFRGGENTFGYYTQTTNRLATFDLTGIEGMLPPGAPVEREELITQIFSRPQAERQVATVLHEACHQIAFNTGLQRRLGDYPFWLSEGIATFFESPDFTSSNGWGGTGKVNWYNLNNLRHYARTRPADSLMKLLTQDDLLRQGETATAAYAESWGLTFFLIKRKSKSFVEYLKLLHARPPGNPSDAKQRMDDFRTCFGDDLEKLDKEFVRFIGSLR
jgi:hypothetical protein